jgi:hypothetical protein
MGTTGVTYVLGAHSADTSKRWWNKMITPKVFLYSCWCAIVSMEVVVAFQFVLGAFLITPEMVVVMNRSPEWAQSVGSIIAMLTPDPFGTALCGTLILATCLAFFGSMTPVETVVE